MNPTQIETSYEPFSARPEYRSLNRCFVESLDLLPGPRVLDMACGTGVLTEEILRRFPSATVVGLDVSGASLTLAERSLARWNDRVSLIEASADRVPLPDGSFDAVVMGNAIHNLPDLEKLLREVHRLLTPQGPFAFSTSFYAGTFEVGTEGFYLLWMKEAFRFIAEEDRRLREAGAPGIPRTRGRRPRSASHPWLSPDDYRGMLETTGFRVGWWAERVVRLSRESFESVGSYAGLAEVLMSGYPVEIAARALARGVEGALEAMGLETVPRRWLEMEAFRC